MKIFVNAKPLSRIEGITKTYENSFIIRVKEKPEDGKANKAIIKALAKYFKIPSSEIEIVSGHSSKRKIISINL
ncbi:MAG: DUF167 domain-containing protein [Candidatus Omnitrophica bacterium]|nr:DUF167 domain-containing protein [Candidatus Omnitrophota bacterium]